MDILEILVQQEQHKRKGLQHKQNTHFNKNLFLNLRSWRNRLSSTTVKKCIIKQKFTRYRYIQARKWPDKKKHDTVTWRRQQSVKCFDVDFYAVKASNLGV